jgi:hypothetical protein
MSHQLASLCNCVRWLFDISVMLAILACCCLTFVNDVLLCVSCDIVDFCETSLLFSMLLCS